MAYLPGLQRLSGISVREIRRGRCSGSSPNSAPSGRIRSTNSRCSSEEIKGKDRMRGFVEFILHIG